MSELLPPDFIINESVARRLIDEQFRLNVRSCVLLGEGFDNAVFLINEHLVFRFPRRIVSISLIEHEIRILGGLSSLVKLPIPKPSFIGMPGSDYEAPFYGHEFLKGRTGCSVKLNLKEQHELAHDLGIFLHHLHRVDPENLSLRPEDLKPLYDRVDKTQMMTWLFERFDAIKDHYQLHHFKHIIDDIVNDADRYIPKQYPAVLIHSDLYHRHLLFSDHNKLCGIIDWGDSCLSDRVVDFSVIYQFLDKACHQSFFDAYGPASEDEKTYARFLGLYYIIALLWFGHDRHDQALIKTSLFALERI